MWGQEVMGMIPREADPKLGLKRSKSAATFYCLLLIFQLAMPHTTHIHATPLTPINAEDHRLCICFVVVLCTAFPCDGSMQMFKTEFSQGSGSRKPLQPCPRANPSHTLSHTCTVSALVITAMACVVLMPIVSAPLLAIEFTHYK